MDNFTDGITIGFKKEKSYIDMSLIPTELLMD